MAKLLFAHRNIAEQWHNIQEVHAQKMRAAGSLLKNSWSNILKNNTYLHLIPLASYIFPLLGVFKAGLLTAIFQPHLQTCLSRESWSPELQQRCLFYSALSHLCSLESTLFDEFWITTQHKQQHFYSKYPYLQSRQLSFPVCWSPEPFQYPS